MFTNLLGILAKVVLIIAVWVLRLKNDRLESEKVVGGHVDLNSSDRDI